MKISTKGRYGLRAFIDLACYGAEEPVSISSISARQEISERYLEQLMAKLKKAGLVKSIRGAGGGYRLAKDAAEVLLVMYSEHLKETWNLRLVQHFIRKTAARSRAAVSRNMSGRKSMKAWHRR